MSTKYKITKERLAQIIKEEYESVHQELAEKKKKKKPDADGDGVPDWADKKPGKDDHAEDEETQKENINVDVLRQLIHSELKNL